MILRDLKQHFITTLTALYPKEEVEAFFYRLTEHILHMKRIDVVLHNDTEVKPQDYNKFLEALKRLQNHEPIQYVIGVTEFFGLEFIVNESVLIPRPETEELVARIINDVEKDYSKSNPVRILDIGTGSGCIAISIASKLPNAIVYAVDVSNNSLNIALKNADKNNVKVEFIEANILDANSWTQVFKALNFNIIVSNPPYVLKSEKELMKPNVLKFEPYLALFVDNDDPLEFYKAILEFSKTYLEGSIYFEINEALGNEMIDLCKQKGFDNIELQQDIFGKDRIVKANNI